MSEADPRLTKLLKAVGEILHEPFEEPLPIEVGEQVEETHAVFIYRPSEDWIEIHEGREEKHKRRFSISIRPDRICVVVSDMCCYFTHAGEFICKAYRI